jgi:hypothetical protein
MYTNITRFLLYEDPQIFRKKLFEDGYPIRDCSRCIKIGSEGKKSHEAILLRNLKNACPPDSL